MSTSLNRQVAELVREWAGSARGTAVDRLRVTRSAYASSATVLNVHLVLAGGERMRLVCKLGGPGALLPAARGVRRGDVSDSARETWMYRSVLASDGTADAPHLLASGALNDGAPWLLLEWAGSVDLGQVGSRAVWRDAASRLARLHVWGESRVEALLRGSVARWDDPSLHLGWAQQARASFHGEDDDLAPLWRRYQLVAKRLATMPKTLVHGDFNASNVLVTRSPNGLRIRIIDWETAGVGPGLLDLASLLSGRLPDRHRTEMIAGYRAAVAGSRLGRLSAGEFDEALSYCRLALAVRWLGWAPGWSAPDAHAQDWRSEARAAAGTLGLLT